MAPQLFDTAEYLDMVVNSIMNILFEEKRLSLCTRFKSSDESQSNTTRILSARKFFSFLKSLTCVYYLFCLVNFVAFSVRKFGNILRYVRMGKCTIK